MLQPQHSAGDVASQLGVPLPGAEGEGDGEDGTVDDLLQLFTSRPAPPTLRHPPAKLAQRVQDQAVLAMQAAVEATERGLPEEEQLRAHRWLWAMPGILLAAPTKKTQAGEEGTEEPAEAVTHLVRRRLQHAEQGNWEVLLRDAVARQAEDARHAATAPAPAQGARPDAAEDRAAWARRVVSKVKGGCLRSATQLALGDEHAPRTQETVDAIRDLTALPTTPEEDADLQRMAAGVLRDSPLGKRAGRRIARARARTLKPGAEPGASGWRNSLLRAVVLRPDGAPIADRWNTIWIHGSAPPRVCRLWSQACLVGLRKPSGGVRPIALGEALLKYAEVCLAELVGPRLRAALGPCQLGCRTPGGAPCKRDQHSC